MPTFTTETFIAAAGGLVLGDTKPGTKWTGKWIDLAGRRGFVHIKDEGHMLKVFWTAEDLHTVYASVPADHPLHAALKAAQDKLQQLDPTCGPILNEPREAGGNQYVKLNTQYSKFFVDGEEAARNEVLVQFCRLTSWKICIQKVTHTQHGHLPKLTLDKAIVAPPDATGGGNNADTDSDDEWVARSSGSSPPAVVTQKRKREGDDDDSAGAGAGGVSA
jgi:hypothetical protein